MKKAQRLDAEELVPWVYAPQEIEEEPRRLTLRRSFVLFGVTALLIAVVVIGTLMRLHPASNKDLEPTPNNQVECDQLEHQCKRTSESVICEGKGTCQCGVCVCEPPNNPQQHFLGKFCECDNSCPKTDNGVCSGNGQCHCGRCTCEIGYTGIDCSICTDGAYQALKKCDAFKDCVLCHPSKSDSTTESNCIECPLQSNATEAILGSSHNDGNTAVQPCILIDPKDSCAFKFIYVDNLLTNISTVHIVKDKMCPSPIKLI